MRGIGRRQLIKTVAGTALGLAGGFAGSLAGMAGAGAACAQGRADDST